jgi:hypothetical protein
MQYCGNMSVQPWSLNYTSLRSLAAHAAQKDTILANVSKLCNGFVQKRLFAFQYVHELLWEFMGALEAEGDMKQFDEFLPHIIENAMLFLSTRPGSKVGVTASCAILLLCPISSFLKGIRFIIRFVLLGLPHLTGQ